MITSCVSSAQSRWARSTLGALMARCAFVAKVGCTGRYTPDMTPSNNNANPDPSTPRSAHHRPAGDTPSYVRASTRGNARTLSWIACIAWGATVVFGIWSASVDTGPGIFGNVDSGDVALKMGLGALADIALMSAVTSTIGLIVLRGVEALIDTDPRRR